MRTLWVNLPYSSDKAPAAGYAPAPTAWTLLGFERPGSPALTVRLPRILVREPPFAVSSAP